MGMNKWRTTAIKHADSSRTCKNERHNFRTTTFMLTFIHKDLSQIIWIYADLNQAFICVNLRNL
jgi:hypothetical protein